MNGEEKCSECGDFGTILYECHVCGVRVCDCCIDDHLVLCLDDEGDSEPK